MLECLKNMRLDQLSKERYFADVLEDAEEMSVDEESTVSDEHSAFESEEAPESLPSHSTGSGSSLHPFLPPQPPLSYLSNLTYWDLFSESDILSTDVDEAGLTKELADEDILDVLDIVQSKEYENSLWKTHR
jgi:hypothetical protein